MNITHEEEVAAWDLLDEWFGRLGQDTPAEIERVAVDTMVHNIRTVGAHSIRSAMTRAIDADKATLPYVFGILRRWRESRAEVVSRPQKYADTSLLRKIQAMRNANVLDSEPFRFVSEQDDEN